jgi:UDP-2,3-diacylglucosamine hydrolase
MDKISTTIFISDLHLQENCPEIVQLFLKFLNGLNKRSIDNKLVDALYILGDLFEFWIGDDDHTILHKIIIQALKSVSQHIPIYFLYGNRDFLIGKRFLQASGCQLIKDQTKITLYQQDVLLMHGDTLCTKDITYLKARKKMHNKLIQTLFLLMPLNFRKKIADNLRNTSKLHTSTADAEIMDVTQSEVEKLMEKHQVNFLIHGHTHKPGIHEFLLNDSLSRRLVLGAWHNQGNMLMWDSDGNKQLINIVGENNNAKNNNKP